MKKTLLATTLTTILCTTSSVAQATLVSGVLGNNAWTTNHANFTMLSPTGATVGGANNVNMTWDGNAFTSSSDYSGPGSYSNVTASSTSTFFSHFWTAHDIQMFLPGTYAFDTALGGGTSESGIMNVMVPTGQLGMHMLFDWNGSLNIDVFVVLAQNSMFGTAVMRNTGNASSCDAGIIQNCLWNTNFVTGYKPVAGQVWMLASVDGNGDSIMGIPMAEGGPFAGFNVSFNANLGAIASNVDCPALGGCNSDPVPVPAAMWLFGSGLIGLFGTATRKKIKHETSN